MSCKTWFLGFAASVAALASAAAPWAVWTDFTGADANTGLAPQVSSTQNGINGGDWRLKLGSGSSVTGGGVLKTGTGRAPTIVFNGSIDVGRSSDRGKPMTVLLEIDGPVSLVADRPLVHIGNGSTGVGMAMATATDVRGTWGNAAWGDPRVEVSAMAQKGPFYVALGTCYDTNTPTAVAVIDPVAQSVTWNALEGLTGKGITSTQITFGNFVNATSGGLNYTLRSISVFSGRATNEELLAYVPHQITKSEGGDWRFEDVTNVKRATVTVSGARSLNSFTVNNTNTDYLIQGDAIGGTIALTKQGSGRLALTGANTFSGGVVIEGGTVVESGVKNFSGALGTGKNGSWANKITLKNGTFDINGTQNYRNNSQTGAAYWGWLSLQTLVLGGQADGVMEITGGVFGIGTSTMIIYDATNNPGKATISAPLNFTGTSSAATSVLSIGYSTATDVEVEFTGGMHTNQWLDGGATTIEKTGEGTMKISCGFGFKGLKVTRGKVLLGQDNLFMNSAAGGKFETLTLNGGTLDLGGTTQTLAPSAISYTSGTLDNGTLALSAGTYAGPIAGTLNVTATGALSLTGSITTTGTLRVAPGASLTLARMPESARIVVDCSVIAQRKDGTAVSPLTIPGEVDDARITWEGFDERFMTRTRNENGTYTVTVDRTQRHFLVMPMGDSITEGSGQVENAPSYRKALAEQMMAAGMNPRFTGARIYKSTPIANEDCRLHTGLSGHRVQSLGNRGGFLQGAPNWLEQAGYPDAITLMIGTNDSTTATGEQAQRDAERVFGLWKTLINQMVSLRPNTWIIVSPITPTHSDRTDINPYISAYNTRIKSLFTTTESTLTVNGETVTCVLGELNEAGKAAFGEGAKVRLASMYDAIPSADNAGYFFDNLHPNQAGYDRMAAVWLEAIKQLADGTNGGLADAEAIVDAYQTAGAMNSITVVFNHDQANAEGFTVNGSAPTTATLSDDARRVTLTLEAALTDGQTVTVARDRLSTTFTAKAATAANRVPSELLTGYTKVKSLAVQVVGNYRTLEAVAGAFTAEPEAANIQAFDRVGYYVTLARPDGQLRYLWVSMDSPYTEIAQLGLPQRSLRTKVDNLRVATNMPGIDAVTEDGVQGLIQFGPNSLSTNAADSEAPLSLGRCYDWNCADGGTAFGYGYMQLFRLYPDGKPDSGMPASTLFAYNRWSAADSGSDEILLGDLANHQQYADGTTTASLCGIYTTSFPTLNTTAYSVRNIEVWVRGTSSLTWGGAAEGEWNTTDGSVWEENKAFVAGDAVTFGALTAGTSATITVPEALMATTLDVTQNTYTFSGAGSLTATSLTLAENALATFNLPLTASSASVGEGATLTVKQGSFVTAPTGKGTFVKQGTIGSDDTTIDLSSASNLLPMYTVESGKLTLTKSNSSNGAGYSSGTTPFFSVASGAHLVWNANDIVGWGRANTVKVAEISGVLEKTMDKNETFSGRLLLKDGGELRNTANNDYFMLHNSAVIEVAEGASAKLTGKSFKSNNGTPVFKVGEGATLTVEASINVGAPLKKEGKGLWIQAENGLTGSGTLTVAEGTLRVERANGAEIWVAGPITVEAGATLDIRKDLKRNSGATTINGTLTGNGLFYTSAAAASLSITASGRIVPTGALRLEVAGGVTVASGATIVANGNKLTFTNGLTLSGDGKITIEVPSAAPFSLEPKEIISNIGDLTAENFMAPTGYTLKKEAGALTLALAQPPKPDQGEGAADTTEWTTEAAQAILKLTDGTAPTKITATTKGGAQALTAAEASAALEVFQNIAEAGADGTTVTVTYDFGIAEMIPDGDAIEVIAEVKSGEAVAELTEGTTLGLVLDDEASTPVADVSFAPVEGQTGKYRALVDPAKLSKPFKVRATR